MSETDRYFTIYSFTKVMIGLFQLLVVEASSSSSSSISISKTNHH